MKRRINIFIFIFFRRFFLSFVHLRVWNNRKSQTTPPITNIKLISLNSCFVLTYNNKKKYIWIEEKRIVKKKNDFLCVLLNDVNCWNSVCMSMCVCVCLCAQQWYQMQLQLQQKTEKREKKETHTHVVAAAAMRWWNWFNFTHWSRNLSATIRRYRKSIFCGAEEGHFLDCYCCCQIYHQRLLPLVVRMCVHLRSDPRRR